MAPQTPPTFGSPRRSRGAPLFRLSVMGPRHGPPNPPDVRIAPAKPWRSSVSLVGDGAPTWPPTPQRSKRPGAAVPLLYHGGPDMAPNPPTFEAARRSRAASLSWGPATPKPWRSSICALLCWPRETRRARGRRHRCRRRMRSPDADDRSADVTGPDRGRGLDGQDPDRQRTLPDVRGEAVLP